MIGIRSTLLVCPHTCLLMVISIILHSLWFIICIIRSSTIRTTITCRLSITSISTSSIWLRKFIIIITSIVTIIVIISIMAMSSRATTWCSRTTRCSSAYSSCPSFGLRNTFQKFLFQSSQLIVYFGNMLVYGITSISLFTENLFTNTISTNKFFTYTHRITIQYFW